MDWLHIQLPMALEITIDETSTIYHTTLSYLLRIDLIEKISLTIQNKLYAIIKENLKINTGSSIWINHLAITDSNLLVRRLTLAANHVLPAQAAAEKQERELSLFDFGDEAVQQAAGQRENRLQQAQLEIKRRFGKNAVLKGMSLLDGATAKERNEQIGGHKA